MDKAALFALLMQQAPRLFAALNTPTSNPGSMFDGESPLDPAFGREETLMEMVGNRGYDPGLIEDSMPSYLNDSSAASMAVDSLRPAMLDIQKGFPSDWSSGLDIINIAEDNRIGQYPAETSAGNMLNPKLGGIPNDADIPSYPGGLSEVDHLSNQIDNLPNSPYKDSLVEEMNKKAKRTTYEDLFTQLINQKAYNK